VPQLRLWSPLSPCGTIGTAGGATQLKLQNFMTPKSLLTLISLLASSFAFAQIPGDITLEPAFGGATFTDPVAVRHANDGSGRRFVVELDGLIKIVDENDNVLATPFLDITGLTEYFFEQGLLGLAFHPEFSTNGLVYINHSANGVPDVSNGDSVVVEYQVSDLDPNQLDTSTRREIMIIPQDFGNHNGGDIHFGPDGYLYIGLGDGGGSNDPCNRSQILDPSTTPSGGCRSGEAAWLLGKMLRIDIDNTTPPGSNNLCAANPNLPDDGSAEYAIPADNPFVGQVDRCSEVWAYGLRNPFRFSFDRDTGDLWIGDVGQGTWEEINFEASDSVGGNNFGWRTCEGNWNRGSTTESCALSRHTGPVIEYRRNAGNCSVTGGFRYRGPVTSMQGYYLFTDYCLGNVRFAREQSPGNWVIDGTLGSVDDPVGFGEDEEGNLYLVSLDGAIFVYRGDTGPSDPVFQDRFED